MSDSDIKALINPYWLRWMRRMSSMTITQASEQMYVQHDVYLPEWKIRIWESKKKTIEDMPMELCNKFMDIYDNHNRSIFYLPTPGTLKRIKFEWNLLIINLLPK